MNLGALTAFIAYIMQILLAIMMAMYVLMTAPRAAVCAERIQAVLDTDPSVTSASPAKQQPMPDAAARPAKERDDATTALTTVLAQHGVWGVRVHAVRASRDAVAVVQRLATR